MKKAQFLAIFILLFGLLTAAISQDDRAVELYNEGIEHYNQQNYRPAISNLERALRLFSENALSRRTDILRGKLIIGQCHYNLEQFEEAITTLDPVIRSIDETSPNNEQEILVKSLYLTGLCYSQDENEDSQILAHAKFKRGLHYAQDDAVKADLFYNMGLIDYTFRDYEEAISNLTQANLLFVQLNDTRHFSTKLYLANVYKSLNNNGEAIKWYQQILQFQLGGETQKYSGQSFKSLGTIYYDMGDYANAIRNFNNAKEIFLLLHDDAGTAETSFLAAYCYFELKQYDKAAEAFKQAHTYFSQNGNYETAKLCLSGIAQAQSAAGNNAEALLSFQNAIIQADPATEAVLIAENHYNIGRIHKEQNEDKKAISHFYKSGLMYQTAGEFKKTHLCFLTIGDIHFNKNRYDSSAHYYSKALDINPHFSDLGEKAKLTQYIAKSYYFAGNYQNALIYYKNAIKLYDSLNDFEYAADISALYEAVGDMYSNQQDYTNAKMYFEKALHNADKKDAANIYIKIASINEAQNQPQFAIDYFEKAKQGYTDLGLFSLVISVDLEISNIFQKLGNYEKALNKLDQTLQTSKHYKNVSNRASIPIAMGNLFFEIGSSDSAKTAFQKALTISVNQQPQDSINIAAAHTGLGNIHYTALEFDDALEQYKAANQIVYATRDTLNLAKSYLNLGNIYRMKGYDDSQHLMTAKKYYTDALHLFEKEQNVVEIGNCKNNLALIDFIKGDFKTAKQKLNEAERIIQRTYLSKNLVTIYTNQGVIFEHEEQYQNAYDKYFSAIKIIERCRSSIKQKELQKGYIDANSGAYDKIISLLFGKLDQPEKAIYFLERSKSKNLVDDYYALKLLTNPEQAAEIKKLNDKLAEYNQTQKLLEQEQSKPTARQNSVQVSHYTKKISDLEHEIENIENVIATTDPNYLGNTRWSTMNQLGQAIPQNTALVSYYSSPKVLYIYVLTRENPNLISVQINKNELDSHILTYRNYINQTIHWAYEHKTFPVVQNWQAGNIAPILDISDNLYTNLITPIYDIIKSKEKLVFVPSGLVNYVPFQALSQRDANGKPTFLIENWQVINMTTTTMIPNLLASSNTLTKEEIMKGTVVLANPMGDLVGAGAEAQLLKKLTRNKAQVFENFLASEKQAKISAPQSTILIPTTHYHADLDNPELSFLLLYPTDKQTENDGYWTVQEISQANYPNLQLVVLPDCNTAQGEEFPVGEVRNIVSAFARRNAKSILATLWPVNDEATFVLMEPFYTEIYNNAPNLNAPQALRNAQIKMLNSTKYKHPLCWAAFSLYGYWN